MSTFDTPEKDLSNAEGKYDKSKVCTYLVMSSSMLTSCLVTAMYNIVHRYQKECLILKIYIPGIKSWVGSKIYYNDLCTEKLVHELHGWI